MDFASRWAARLLYPLGISTNPTQVIIGRNDWLYLGDKYNQTQTVDRRPPSESDFLLGQKIGRATEAWDAYLTSKGVKLFRVMIGPNKGSVYPENLPIWAKPSFPNATDALLVGTGTTHYIDLRAPLLAAKANLREALYYKTDTHWNYLGAGVAFQTFAQQVSVVAPDIKWPLPSSYELNLVAPRRGGDLANFLRITAHLSDYEPMISALGLPIETIQSDFDSKKVLHQGGNRAIDSPMTPLLVQSTGALNSKRVLWLRDSFGAALSPLMAATFNEVLQLHWEEALKPGGRFLQLVEDWKPDYVFFTVVERDSRHLSFAAYPPPVVVPKGEVFNPIRTTSVSGTNHLLKGATESEFQITGADPFADFAISSAVNPSEVRYLSIDLTCADNSQSVPLQLFWLENGNPYFDEERSIRLAFRTGQNMIDLHTVSKLVTAGPISRIRLDIEAKDHCTNFKLSNPSFGPTAAKSR